MLVDFNTLPQNTKVWVFQSNRSFTKKEIPKINELLEQFIAGWQRHGSDLRASFKIVYNHFIVLAVADEVSGCSIDVSVHAMLKIEQQFALNLTDKLQVAFRDGENINTVSLADFKKYVGLGKINSDTIVFNNMVDSVVALQNNWEVPASASWHQKYF